MIELDVTFTLLAKYLGGEITKEEYNAAFAKIMADIKPKPDQNTTEDKPSESK